MSVTRRDIELAAMEAAGEILDDIDAGTVPASVREFCDLHDHVDANDYVGFTDPARRAHWNLDDQIRSQAVVNAWLLAGRPIAALHTVPQVETGKPAEPDTGGRS